ncbi:MAG: hypothetical protein ACO3YZ_06835 [Candidatus Nanopelagicaceae bacterium]
MVHKKTKTQVEDTMTRYAHQDQYASFENPHNTEYTRIAEELYQAGRSWGQAGNTTIPKYFPLDRGDGTITQIPIVKAISFNAQEFVRGWRETKPATATKTRKGRK